MISRRNGSVEMIIIDAIIGAAVAVWFWCWIYMATSFVNYYIEYFEFKKTLRYCDEDTCMCGGSLASHWNENHGFVSTLDYQMRYEPKFN